MFSFKMHRMTHLVLYRCVTNLQVTYRFKIISVASVLLHVIRI